MDERTFSTYSAFFKVDSHSYLSPQSDGLSLNVKCDIANTSMYKFNLESFLETDAKQREEFLNNLTNLDLVKLIDDVQEDVTLLKIEDHMLHLFLEKKDPKRLVGIKRRHSSGKIFNRLRQGSESFSVNRMSFRGSKMSTTSSHRLDQKKFGDIKLNLRSRSDMVQNFTMEIEKRMEEMRQNFEPNLKKIRACTDELRLRQIETKELAKNFTLQFLNDESDEYFLEKALSAQVFNKWRTYFKSWLKRTDVFVDTIRINVSAVRAQCANLRHDMSTKGFMSNSIRPVDFEKLNIRLEELYQVHEEQHVQKFSLKASAAIATRQLSKLLKQYRVIEMKNKMLSKKFEQIVRNIERSVKEVKQLAKDIEYDSNELKRAEERILNFTAPSIDEYMGLKVELSQLIKEFKILQRKLSIANIHLTNLQKKRLRRRKRNVVSLEKSLHAAHA